ncbi:hypothetical protein PUV54_04620 [Hyphococcus flavus]|uniref:Uncharacterized protein n=1 Tax=Hyphococcus flavus TaxID=1866326 RepID=A0AAE9ZGS2_9PROT|nr:hypothetical protein [Hyphococcus flavus]WDI32477.1 hypothetical protein PUV54_04620 [Hyphococcus flavus]
MSDHIIAYCETPLQTRIAARVASVSGTPEKFSILIGNWTDDVGQHEAAAQTALKLEILEAGEPSLTPKARWRHVCDATESFFRGGMRRLVMFQDQHFFSQAVVTGARRAGAAYDLIQDGFLDFDMRRVPAPMRALWPVAKAVDRNGPRQPSTRIRPFAYKKLYLSHFFAHTRPDRIFVYGRSIAARLEKQFGIPPESFIVSGPALERPAPPDAVRPLRNQGDMRVIFFDQCFLRYQRMHKSGWSDEYLPVIDALGNFHTDVKLHPAQTEDCVSDIVSTLAGRGEMLDRSPIAESVLDTYDVAVTCTSTSFLDCLTLGIPVIFVDLSSSFDRMPLTKSPLLKNVASIPALERVLRLRKTGEFEANATGLPLIDLIAYDAGGASLIASHLTDAGPAQQHPARE